MSQANAAQSPPLKSIAPTGLLGLLWSTAPAVAGILLLKHLGDVSVWLESQGRAGLAIYIATFILASGTGLLPTYAQAILGGWVFGVAAGLPAALTGFVGGALLGYAIAFLVSRDSVEHLIERNPKAKAVRNAIVGGGFWRTLGMVALFRLPSTPFALTNLAMASTRVPVGPFALGTAIGMAPRTAVAVSLAAAASATGAADIVAFAEERGVAWLMLGIGTMVIAFAIIGSVAKRAIARITPASDGAPSPAANQLIDHPAEPNKANP
jgi:uncharacterized membrane protein YdjX (TVP38/TMEM64 family)